MCRRGCYHDRRPSISVTLTDLLTPVQVLSAGQALSDLQFTLSNAPGTQGPLTASGQLANIGAGGTVTDVSGTPIRWIGQGPPPPGGSGTFTVSGNTILMEAIELSPNLGDGRDQAAAI